MANIDHLAGMIMFNFLLFTRYWATGIDGGNSEANFEHNDTMSSCAVSVTLTEEGMEHTEEVR